MQHGFGSKALKNIQNQQRLVNGGMSYPESAAAIEAAAKEGREVGSVEDERARAAQRKALTPTPRPMEHKTLAKLPGATDGPCVLFIEGFAMADFMAGNLLGLPSKIPGVPTSQEAKVAWRGMRIMRISCLVEMELSKLAMEACCVEIASGLYHAVVVVDLAQDHRLFESELGTALQTFVGAGGALAFPTSEGLNLVSTMARLFETAWVGSSYYRTQWSAAEENRENIQSTFGDRLSSSAFSAKACSLRKVPPHERCFGVNEKSRTQSLVPFMTGQVVSKPAEPDADYDVCVATHRFGEGTVAFFGDVNCEGRTAELVAAFIGSTSKEFPVNAWRVQPGAAGSSARAGQGTARQQPPAAQCADGSLLNPGTRVEVHGLQSSPHLNGRSAHVLHLDKASGRFAVELELTKKGENHSFKAKEANLKVLPARARTAAALQELLDQAQTGDRVSIAAGRFVDLRPRIGGGLEIKSAITLEGRGPTASVLTFPIVVVNGAAGDLLHLSKFAVEQATINVGGLGIRRAWLSHLHISLDCAGGVDVLTLEPMSPERDHRDSILVEDCMVRGGSDGVMINTDGVRLLRCRVLNAANRGIFANHSFIVEDCTVQGCGGYGMKTRSGCERRGRNHIQTGPWDAHQCSGGFGMGPSDELYDEEGEESDGVYDEEGEEEVGMYGFTHDEEMELLSQGVKPWEDDAHDVLAALRGDY